MLEAAGYQVAEQLDKFAGNAENDSRKCTHIKDIRYQNNGGFMEFEQNSL